MFDGETPGDLVGSTALVGRIDEGEDVGEDLGGGFPQRPAPQELLWELPWGFRVGE